MEINACTILSLTAALVETQITLFFKLKFRTVLAKKTVLVALKMYKYISISVGNISQVKSFS